MCSARIVAIPVGEAGLRQVGLTEVKYDYAIKRNGAPLILIEDSRLRGMT